MLADNLVSILDYVCCLVMMMVVVVVVEVVLPVCRVAPLEVVMRNIPETQSQYSSVIFSCNSAQNKPSLPLSLDSRYQTGNSLP